MNAVGTQDRPIDQPEEQRHVPAIDYRHHRTAGRKGGRAKAATAQATTAKKTVKISLAPDLHRRLLIHAACESDGNISDVASEAFSLYLTRWTAHAMPSRSGSPGEGR